MIRRLLATTVLALCAMPVLASAGSFDLAEVDRRAERLAASRSIVGLAVAVIDDGEIVFSEGYGRTVNGSNARMVDADTVFRWASVSKSVAAATALTLAEDGYFGLDSPVDAYVEAALPETDEPVTLEHILSHQVGISRNAFDGRIEDGRAAADVKSMLEDASVTCQPGSCHSYQNVAFDLSRDMIETATGLPYKAVVNERVFEPLGMATASVSMEGLTTSGNWARPHNSGGRQYNSVKPTYYRIPAAAGVNSSVTDLAKWVVANLDGEGVPAKVAAEMQDPRVRTRRRSRLIRNRYPFMRDARYALGWRSYDYEGGNRVIAHRGAVQGYRASVIFDPETGDGVALLWNSNSSRPNGLAYEIMDQSYGKPKVDWMRLNRTPARKRPSTIRTVKAKPSPEPSPKPLSEPAPVIVAEAPPVQSVPVQPPMAEQASPQASTELTAEDIEKLIAEEDARRLEDSLAATCPCPEEGGPEDAGLSGSGE